MKHTRSLSSLAREFLNSPTVENRQLLEDELNRIDKIAAAKKKNVKESLHCANCGDKVDMLYGGMCWWCGRIEVMKNGD